MLVVLDTNVLVSALLTPNGKAAYILDALVLDKLTICYDYRILEEYQDVLPRAKFHIPESEIRYVLDLIKRNGLSFVPTSLAEIPFTDESDRAFFEMAKFMNAILVSGNLKHYPDDSCVMSVSDFYDLLIS